MKIYIASSWKNKHAVEMLTAKLRDDGHKVMSFVENNFGEGTASTKFIDFEKWIHTEKANQSFEFDTHSAMSCDCLIYISPSGKDAAAECGMCYGQRLAGRTIPMVALYSKGEDFGLMRKMFDYWCENYREVLEFVRGLNKEGEQK